jgi:NMD protein affecting ribosome stability and mRNA decay
MNIKGSKIEKICPRCGRPIKGNRTLDVCQKCGRERLRDKAEQFMHFSKEEIL